MSSRDDDPVTLAPSEDAALLAAHGDRLLALAHQSIRARIYGGASSAIDIADYPPPLQEQRASFVTLSQDGELRGCIGSATAWRPLVTDVAENAISAATEDYRFAPLLEQDLETLAISISLLSPPSPISASSEGELLAQLRPMVDGLILQEGARKGLFLPQVWEHLPDPADFLAQLRLKAGLPQGYWSSTLLLKRFTSASIADPSYRGLRR